MKKQFGIALVTALLMLLTFALCASAAGTATVVYLSGSGNNEADGLTAETAVAGLNAAYNLLDPDKDGTVVLCGAFTQRDHFARAHSAKSITITSVYGGVDYRDSGAVYKTAKYARFGLADDTTFENVTFESSDGTSFMVVGQHHAVTIGEGVAMNNYIGGDIGKAFWVVGSVQHNFGGAAGPKYVDRPTATHVTVLSGNDMIVVGGPRQFGTAQGVTAANACTYGDINVRIGGMAEVNELYAAGYQSRNTTVGGVSVEVFGDASVGAVYGAGVHNVAASDLTLLWTSGTVGAFAMKPNGKVGLTASGAVTLETTEDVRYSDSYATVAASGFTAQELHTHDFDYDNGKVLTPATCLEDGTALYTCKTCSATEEGTLAKTGHTFGAWTVVTPAAVGVPGEEKRTCKICDAFETREIPAIGTATVVYLSGSGNNEADGRTPETAVAGLNAAYNLLDPDKDCTVVLCGEFLQRDHFARAHSAKSITITSVYGGVDYRDSGAVYKTAKNARFGLADDTTFENVTFESSDGTSFLLVGQHHALTIGEGVVMNNYTGTDAGKAFWVVGSVQWNFGGAAGPKYVDRPTATNVTVLSGSDMIVVGGPRQFGTAQGVTAANACTYGDINVRIGGMAEVNELYAAGYQSRNTTVGGVSVEVFGDASVGAVYGAGVHNVAASDLTLLWTSGTVGAFAMKPNGSVGLTASGDVTLATTANVRSTPGYAAIAASGFTVHREIPATTANLEKVSVSALSDENGIGAIRLIAKLSTPADAVVTNYGIFVAKTEAIGTAKMVAYTETTGNETSFALDITEIPHEELDTAIYAWAFATVDGGQITLPILVGRGVNGILTEMGV